MNLEHFAKTHICPDCRDASRLAVRWNSKADEVVCHRCGRTSGFVKRKSVTEQWIEDPDSLPVQVSNRLAAKHGKEIEEIAAGLPADMAEMVRQKYGLPTEQEKTPCR